MASRDSESDLSPSYLHRHCRQTRLKLMAPLVAYRVVDASEVCNVPHMKRMLALLGVFIASIVLDQGTKEIAIASLKGKPAREYLGESVRLVYAENPGAFLGLGRDWPDSVRMAIFIGLAAVAVVVGAVMVWKKRDGKQKTSRFAQSR